MFNITWSSFVLAEFVASHRGSFSNLRCLDIGSGTGEHSRIFKFLGMSVDSLDKYEQSAEIKADFMYFDFQRKYDVIFCSHVIEHQRNVGNFLDKIYDTLSDDGILILSAPKHDADRLIEGHLSSFRTSYFIQQILYSGFDLKKGKYLSCGGIENSAILPKRPYSEHERTEAGYKWTSEHQARSIIKLTTQGPQVPNDGWAFHNCELYLQGSTFKSGDVVRQRGDVPLRGLNLCNDRWGFSFIL